MNLTIEDIPENNMLNTNIKPIPKQYAKQIKIHEQPKITKLTYDDILNKMGMFVKDGKLHTLDKVPQNKVLSNQVPQNSYIYNKYFKNELQQETSSNNVPKTINEYKLMLVKDIIQKERIRRIKSTKLIMPNSNINIAQIRQGNLNKLFKFV
jgi:hypothetical protein